MLKSNLHKVYQPPWLFIVAILLPIIPGTVIDEAQAETSFGHVMARGLYRGPSGAPIYAEIESSRNIIKEYGEAVGPLADAVVMNTSTYNAIITAYAAFKTEHQKGIAAGATIMTKEAYLAADFGTIRVPITNPEQGAATYEDKPVPHGKLNSSTRTVLVRANATIPDPAILSGSKGNILYEAAIDLRQAQIIPPPVRTLLLNRIGQVLFRSEHNIGFKNAYLEDPLAIFYQRKALGPIKNVRVEISSLWATTTDDGGKYVLNYNLPDCFYAGFANSLIIWVEIPYMNFDPEARHPVGYQNFSAFAGVACDIGLYGASSPLYFPSPTDFHIDLALITGVGNLLNSKGAPMPLGDTTYEYTPPPMSRVQPRYLDLNADRVEDTVIPSLTDERYDNVYLNGASTDSDNNPLPADLQRVRDIAPDFSDQGLLKSISYEDLKNTDVYIYRVSTGQRIFKWTGIPEHLIHEDEAGFTYRYTMPGPDSRSWFNFQSGRSLRLQHWQEEFGLPADMSGNEGDFLRSGEQIKIIAINRPTGYIATVTTTMKAPIEGVFDLGIEALQLKAPNLKVKVERAYRVQSGLSKGNENTHTVGFEGSALTNDYMLVISTAWFDEDGTPLPDDLEGYSGRLAVVRANQSLVTYGGRINEFEIQPGQHLQVLKLQGDILGSEHFYVHVFGDKPWDVTTGAGNGPLVFRPDRYVPIKVPIFDEIATRLARNANTYNQQDGNPSLDHVDAVYRWPYRPEMQFSVFDLAVKELKVTDADGNVVDILNSPTTINATDQSLQILYDLLANSNDPLATFGPARELIFAVGGDEQLATTDANQTLTYTNLAQLAEMSTADLMSIRLYQNSDMENVLWEFSLAALEVRSSGDLGSRAKNSFLIRNTEQPIQVEWVSELRATDTLAWKVVALKGNMDTDDLPGEPTGSGPTTKPYAYGQTWDHHIGKVVANSPVTGSGTGRFETPWQSNNYTNNEANQFSFRSDMTDEPHTPATYTSGGNQAYTLNGTKKTDVWRHNPWVGYKITAILNGQATQSVTVKMDEIDAIRQEYINHLASAQGTNAYLIVEVPERSQLIKKDSLGTILDGDWSQSDYTYLVNKHLTMLANIAKSNTSNEAAQDVTVISDIAVSLPSGSTISGVMRINSGWRNPERNERVGGVATSRHMLGRALDIGAEGVLGYGPTSENKSKMMWVMWNALQNAPAIQGNVYIRYLMEDASQPAGQQGLIQTGSPSASGNKPTAFDLADDFGPGGIGEPDGIPDDFNVATHFHVETKPDLSVGD